MNRTIFNLSNSEFVAMLAGKPGENMLPGCYKKGAEGVDKMGDALFLIRLALDKGWEDKSGQAKAFLKMPKKIMRELLRRDYIGEGRLSCLNAGQDAMEFLQTCCPDGYWFGYFKTKKGNPCIGVWKD